MGRERIDSAPVRRTTPLTGEPLLPAAGVRVLDLTRVIAGPVATRTLALLGADVLRIDAPQLPESQDAHSDTGFGKRSVDLDLGSRSGAAAFDELLVSADVVVIGYRPGSVERFGLTSQALAARRPGLVIGRLSAWGRGPWARQRGFDSLVQVATGISSVEATAGAEHPPGALPAQALDHGTGYLLAAAVLRALTEQHDEGGSRVATLSLARTAAWLLDELPMRPGGRSRGFVVRPGEVAHRDGQPAGTAASRPAAGRLRRLPRRLVAPARPAGGGHGRLAHGSMSAFVRPPGASAPTVSRNCAAM